MNRSFINIIIRYVALKYNTNEIWKLPVLSNGKASRFPTKIVKYNLLINKKEKKKLLKKCQDFKTGMKFILEEFDN